MYGIYIFTQTQFYKLHTSGYQIWSKSQRHACLDGHMSTISTISYLIYLLTVSLPPIFIIWYLQRLWDDFGNSILSFVMSTHSAACHASPKVK